MATKKPKLGSGMRFKAVAKKVASSVAKKGMSKTVAKKVGAAVAAKAGMKKYGAKKMASMAKAGKKKS